MVRQTPWIEVYPLKDLGGRFPLRIVNSNARVSLNKELSDYCDVQWKPKAKKGWKSSWLAFAKNLKYSFDGEGMLAKVDVGAMPFFQDDGIVKSIEENQPFAPEQGYVNSLSVGFLTATKDGYVIFQRRAPDVHCPNILIHEPCGYMASMAFAPRAECDLEKYAGDERLFDLKTQYEFRRNEIAKTFGVSPESVFYDSSQDLLAAGWMTKEMYFSTTGKIDVKKSELALPENQEVFFVPFEQVKDLIYNQSRLSKVDANGYRPSDAREIPLIDESLIGLIYGYEKMTGDKLDVKDTIARLNRGGMDIRVHPVWGEDDFGAEYQFQTSF
ncbi:MAG: hypothetical protein AABW47_02320 [Nanoarchaeota archaeon]